MPGPLGSFKIRTSLHHAFNHFVKGMGLHIGVLIPPLDGGDKAKNLLLGIDIDIVCFGELFQEARQPRPVGKDLADLITLLLKTSGC